MENNYHILVIEDDPAIAATLRSGLEREGYRVTWKDRGEEGIVIAIDHQPDLIILDVRLPDGSGFDFCKQLRAKQLKQPILMLTVRSDEVDKVLGLEMGADDYLTKPFGMRELVSRIRALLRRAYGELAKVNTNTLYFKDLTIELQQGRVLRGNEPISLTPTEFRLFAHMVQYSGQALSRRQLLEAVWQSETPLMDERNVNAHIRRLREKIEIDPSEPKLLLTVPGIGYRLVK